MCNRSNSKLREYLSVQKTVRQPSAVFILAVFLSATALWASTSAFAADQTWTGASGTNWFVPGNWFGSTLPGASDGAVIDGANPAVIGGLPATVDTLKVGTTGLSTPTLTINNGGSLTATGARIGYGAGVSGALMVNGTGSTLTLGSGRIGVGYDGTGSLTVSGGASAVSPGAVIGWNAGANGTATVTGAGSSWTNTADLYVGNEGNGTLRIEDHGTVSSINGWVGTVTGSQGTVAVSGQNSAWTMADTFIAGYQAGTTANVTISNGGMISSKLATLGELAGSSGSMTVSGAGSIWKTVEDGSPFSGYMNVGNNGSGSLTVNNGGTVSGYRLYIGNNTGSSGTAVVSGAGSSITTEHNLYIGAGGDGTLTVSNGAQVTAPTIKIAYDLGVNGTLNIGSAQGQAATAPGTVNAGQILFLDGNGSIVFNHTSSNYVFAPTLSGIGVLKALSGTTILTGDNSLFTGSTVVNGGVLTVNGTMSSSATTVASGARLTGSGTIGSVTALTGSTVAPGNSPGTLSVVGNYNQAAGSTYSAELVPGGTVSDLISATGTATITNGALLSVSRYGSGIFTPGTRYTVLTAAGGVAGTYLLSNSALSSFYSATDSYDANNVYLTVAQARAFTSAAATPNQFATAGVLQNMSVNSVLRNAIGSIPTDAEARAAFDQLSGDIYPSIKSAMLEESHFVRSVAIDRIRSAFDAVGAQSTPSATYGLDGLTVWANGYGAWSNTDSDDNAAKFSHSTRGLVIGADAPVSENWRIGLLAGYGRSFYDADANNATGFSDNYTLGAYGGSKIGALGIRLGSAYTWSGVRTDRNVSFTGFSDKLSGQYDARTFQAFGDVGYRLDAGESSFGKLSFEPFAALAYVNLHTNGFTEEGGLAALTTQSGDNNAIFSTAGLRSASDFSLGGVALTATGSLAWRHAYGETTPMTTVNFSGSDQFDIKGVPIAKDLALVEVGLSTHISPNVSFGISYTGQFAGNTRSQGIRGDLCVTF